jgi:alkylated DNA repair dioxygenase AlkB
MSAMYIPGFISEAKSLLVFDRLWNGLNWEKRSDAPRREYWTNVGNRDYSYGRGAGLRTYTAQPTVYDIETIRDRLNLEYGVFFEGCFLNGYEGAKDWLGWHEDDDPGIDHTKPIAIVTLYGGHGSEKPRSIQFREKLGEVDGKMTYGETVDLPLEQGSLCLMPAGFQSTHQHRIPKAGFESRSRISLTFRSLI